MPCQMTLVGDQIVAACGGAVICTDLLGQVRWLRRQLWVPQAIDATWFEQYVEPPRVVDGAVFTTQPGVQQLQCLELQSGRLRWQRTLPRLRRLIHADAQRLIVETNSGLEAFDAANGEPLWNYEVEGSLHASAADSQQLLLSCRERFSSEEHHPALIWLETATGREIQRSPLVNLHDKAPMFGPLVTQGKRVWAFFGRGGREAAREIYELAPHTAAPASQLAGEGLKRWRRPSEHLVDMAAGAFPGWTLLASQQDKQTRLHEEFRGQRNVLATLAAPRRPASFVRLLNLPAGSKARLVLKVAHEESRKWGLEVRFGATSLVSQTIESASTKQGWKQVEIDLSSLAGRRDWLVVAQQDLENKPTLAYWQRLEIVSPKKTQ